MNWIYPGLLTSGSEHTRSTIQLLLHTTMKIHLNIFYQVGLFKNTTFVRDVRCKIEARNKQAITKFPSDVRQNTQILYSTLPRLRLRSPGSGICCIIAIFHEGHSLKNIKRASIHAPLQQHRGPRGVLCVKWIVDGKSENWPNLSLRGTGLHYSTRASTHWCTVWKTAEIVALTYGLYTATTSVVVGFGCSCTKCQFRNHFKMCDKGFTNINVHCSFFFSPSHSFNIFETQLIWSNNEIKTYLLTQLISGYKWSRNDS